MYEYDDRQIREESMQSQAAEVIQRRWKEFIARREAEMEQRRGKTSPLPFTASAERLSLQSASAAAPVDETLNLLPKYVSLLEQRRAVVERSLASQRHLALHFAAQRQRKGEEKLQSVLPEAEQQYWAAVRQICDEQRAACVRKEESEALLLEIKLRHQGTIDEALQREESFRQYIRQLAEEAVFLRTNKKLTPEMIGEFLNKEADQRRDIRNARIRLFLLRHELEKLQRTAAQHDQQKDGMNLIDFEQLKIENTNLNEKIEERNEDLVKLRRKVTITIHVLTHVKEKLEFMKVENAQLRRQVSATEDELNELRDKLAQTRRRRDTFTTSNIKMRESMPMVGSEKLLQDYEKRKTASSTMRQSVLENVAKHRELLATIDRHQHVLLDLQKALALGTTMNFSAATLKVLSEQ